MLRPCGQGAVALGPFHKQRLVNDESTVLVVLLAWLPFVEWRFRFALSIDQVTRLDSVGAVRFQSSVSFSHRSNCCRPCVTGFAFGGTAAFVEGNGDGPQKLRWVRPGWRVS